jgi:hypothetical protein
MELAVYKSFMNILFAVYAACGSIKRCAVRERRHNLEHRLAAMIIFTAICLAAVLFMMYFLIALHGESRSTHARFRYVVKIEPDGGTSEALRPTYESPQPVTAQRVSVFLGETLRRQ